MRQSYYIRRFFLLLLISSLITSTTFAQPSRFSYEKFIDAHGDTLRYRMLFPDYDTIHRYPLVIFLHGSGERGNDNDAQLKWGVMNFATDDNMKSYPCFVIAPQCPQGMGWSNFMDRDKVGGLLLQPAPTKPMAQVIALVQQFVHQFKIDTNRIYITGLSMGGFGTFDAIERYPNMFAAAVPVCGGGDITRAGAIAHVPIWIMHGAEDPGVDPALSLNMVQALVKAGAHPGFTQYPETGHFSWIAAYSDPLLLQWLFRQHK